MVHPCPLQHSLKEFLRLLKDYYRYCKSVDKKVRNILVDNYSVLICLYGGKVGRNTSVVINET